MEGGISGLECPITGNSVAGMGRLCAYLDRVVPGPYRGLLIPKAGRMGLLTAQRGSLDPNHTNPYWSIENGQILESCIEDMLAVPIGHEGAEIVIATARWKK